MLRLTSAQFVAAVHGLQLHWIVNLLSAFSLAEQHRANLKHDTTAGQQDDALVCVQ